MDEHRSQKQRESKQHSSEKQLHAEVQNVISCVKTSGKSIAGRDSVDKKVHMVYLC